MRHSSFQLYLETVSVKKQTLCAMTCFANPDAFTETTFRTASHRPTSAGNQNHQMPDSTSLRHEEKRKERWLFIRGRDGALVEAITLNPRVVGSTPALAVT